MNLKPILVSCERHGSFSDWPIQKMPVLILLPFTVLFYLSTSSFAEWDGTLIWIKNYTKFSRSLYGADKSKYLYKKIKTFFFEIDNNVIPFLDIHQIITEGCIYFNDRHSTMYIEL